MSTRSPNRLNFWLFGALVAWLLAAGCGSEAVDPCQDVSCERGVCDSATRQCVNAGECNDDEQCVDGSYCAGGVCQPDLCDGVSCPRGECSQASGQCVNRADCTAETEASDCLEASYCSGGVCVDEAQLCADLGCDDSRGVCDISARACSNATDCAGDDMNCLAGSYCSEAGSCEENACDAQTQQCPRGVCNPADGGCVNAGTCAAAEDCLDGYSCLDGSCEPTEQLCEVLGCTGNQQCVYDEAALSGSCQEDSDAGCSNALDCVDDRICMAGACAEAQACQNDPYEDNDLISQASEFQGLQSGGVVQSVICSGDADHFKYNLAWQTGTSGTLTARLEFVAEDIGIGDLRLEILEPNGAVAADAITDGTGLLEIGYQVNITNQREWTVRVTDAANSTTTAGVRYALSIELVPDTVDDACSQATELVAPQSIHGTTDIGPSVEMGSSCTSEDNRSGEDVYTFTLDEEAYVSAAVTPDGAEQMSLAVRRGCAFPSSEIACENQQGSDLAYGEVLEAGTYFLVIQGKEHNTGGGYTLDFATEAVVCSYRDDSCLDATVARLCNDARTGFVDKTCEAGCDSATGRCGTDAESCVTAIDASAGGVFTGAIQNFRRDHRHSDTSSCLGHRTDGADAVYKVDARAGQVLRATLDSSFDASLWITDSCADAVARCQAGTDAQNPEELSHQIPADGTYFVVVSANERSVTGNFTLDVQLDAPTCNPGATWCPDADTVEYCGYYGVSWEQYECETSCINGTCATHRGDICPQAVAAGDGDTLTFDPTTYRDEIRAVRHCVGEETPAPDAFYAVDLAADEVLEATVTPQDGGDDPAIYLLEDCMKPHNTCRAGADKEGAGGAETIKYRATTARTVYVVVDGDDPAKASSPWEVSFEIHQPVCTPFEKVCGGADTLEICDRYGISWIQQSCYGFGCTAAACTPPSNDTCPTAADAGTQGATFHHNIRPYSMDYQLPQGVDSCTGFSSLGPDAIYKVEAQAGQIISAEVNSVFDAQLWITTDCTSPAWAQCVVGDDDHFGSAGGPRRTERVQHRVQNGGTFYIIVSSRYMPINDGFPDGDYTLSVSVDDPICTPGDTVCLDAQTMEYCGNFGLQEISYECDGGCENGACANTTGQACVDAIPADDGDFFLIDMTQYGDISDLHKNECGGTTNSQQGMASTGPEVYFEVQVDAGEVLTVNATPHHEDDDPMIYVVTDCKDTHHTCLGGVNDGFDGERETYHFQSHADQTVYVVVDSSRVSARDDYEITFDKAPAVCTPGVQMCDGDDALACNESGTEWIRDHCTFSCDTTTSQCRAPTNDTCAAAFPISSSGRYDIDMWEVDNRTSQTCVSRLGDAEDAFFRFDLQAGEVLDVTVTPRANADEVLLSLVSDCNDVANTCLAGADDLDSGMPERIIYHAQQDETVYLVVESVIQWSIPGVGEVRGVRLIDVTIGQPICTPLETTCASEDLMSYCNASGTTWKTWDCDGSCVSGKCVPASAETCIDAADATGGGFFTGRIEDYQVDHPLGDFTTSCTGSTDIGPDAVYAVEAYPGEIIRAELDAEFWSSVRIVADCTDTVNNCEDGQSGNSGPLEVSHSVNSYGTYYVIVAAFMEAARGQFELTIDTGQVICSSGSARCNGSVEETCSPSGTSWRTKDCLHGCAAGGCNQAPNDTCAGAIDASSGGSFVVDPTLSADDVDLSATGCTDDVTPGPDSVYRVDMLAGDVLEARLTPRYWGDDPAIYVVSDCANAQSTCLAGVDEQQAGDAEELIYQAAQDETVYLIVDGDSVDEADRLWELDLAVGPVVCAPEQTRCADATTMEYCSEHGTAWHPYGCESACSSGACAPPTGDTCIDAISVGAGGTFAADMTDYTNAHHPPSGICPASLSEGNDVVYAIELGAGQTADIRVVPSRHDDAKVYILSSCLSDDFDNTCLADATAPDPMTKTIEFGYTAPVAETVYLVVDSFSTQHQSGVWQVDIDIQ